VSTNSEFIESFILAKTSFDKSMFLLHSNVHPNNKCCSLLANFDRKCWLKKSVKLYHWGQNASDQMFNFFLVET
jgi:hypothetical protein